MSFTDEQKALLVEQFDPKMGSRRKADRGNDVSYLEGYQAIAQANRIFGFDGWSYSLDRLDEKPMADGKGIIYSAVVTVLVGECSRQDVGCHTIRNTSTNGQEKDNVNNPDQHDLARKSAVTDALKRAFRSFGDQFGNSLYDKDSDLHGEIAQEVRKEEQTQRQKQQKGAQEARKPATPAQRHADPWNIHAEVKEELAARQAETPFVDKAAAELANADKGGLASLIGSATTMPLLRKVGLMIKKGVDEKTISDDQRTSLLRAYQAKEAALKASGLT